jgi:hypothetical protein
MRRFLKFAADIEYLDDDEDMEVELIDGPHANASFSK